MARRRRMGVREASIAAYVALALVGVGRAARGQDVSSTAGTFQVATDQTNVQIPEWGGDCGPRPASHTGATGRQATVTVDGTQVVVQDGRRRVRTDGCWSDNPAVHRVSASHAGNTYTVLCQTPDADYQHEHGAYTITVDADRITMHESTEYSWQLRESRCQATATRTLTYQRVGGAPTPVATVDAGSVALHPTPPTPVRRCATPGTPVSLAIAPPRRSLAPGGRTCFAVRALDANGCTVARDASAPPVSWQMARANGAATANDAVMENGCVRAPSGGVASTYAITATVGALTAHAVAAVVSVEELHQLVAQHIEDEEEADAGVPVPTAVASGAGVGASSSVPPAQADARGGGAARTVALLIGCGVLLALGAWLLARRGRKSMDRPSDAGRARRSAVPIPAQELGRAGHLGVTHMLPPETAPTASPSTPTLELRPPQPPPSTVRPLVKRCPVCDQRFTAEIAFCPEHGAALVDGPASAPTVTTPVVPPAPVVPAPSGVIVAPPTATAAAPLSKVCPTCQRRFRAEVVFCGDDGTVLVDA